MLDLALTFVDAAYELNVLYGVLWYICTQLL